MKHLRLAELSLSDAFGRLCYHHEKYRSDSTAYSLDENISILLYLPRRCGIMSAEIDVFNDTLAEIVYSAKGLWQGTVGADDVFRFGIPSGEIGIRIAFFGIRISNGAGQLHILRDGTRVKLVKQCPAPSFQLTVYDRKYTPPKLSGGVIYHIFVDRFNRGGRSVRKKGDRLISEWGDVIPEYPEYPGAPLKNNSYYGGTLDGIRDKLDYIASLGTTAIYLSPIFESASNHKYDTADYMKVDSGFGGDAALEDLIRDCNKKGIKVILDGVFNHTGADSLYFNKFSNYPSVGAYQSKDSPYFGWFDFKEFPDKYTSWWDIEILPRINPDAPECRNFFTGSTGVIEKYARAGVYGLRLDVVDELSDDFVTDVKNTLSRHGDNILYGEVWEDASNKIAYGKRKSYYLGSELDGVMNYPLRTGIIEFVRDKSTGSLEYALTDIINNAPKDIADRQMNLLGTHDTERILTVLGAQGSSGRSNDELAVMKMNAAEREEAVRMLMAAYTIIATLPGIPAVFYGDEAGLEGYGDPFNRMPYPWGKEDERLISHYQAIGRIRRDEALYACGSFKLHILTPELLVFSRELDGRKAITVFNNGREELPVSFSTFVTSALDGASGKEFSIARRSTKIFITTTDTTLKTGYQTHISEQKQL